MSRVSKTSNDNQYTINLDVDDINNISEKELLINKILDKKYNSLLSKNNFRKYELSSKKLAKIMDMKYLEKKQMSIREVGDIKEYGRYLLKHPNTNKMAENFFAILDEEKQKKSVKLLKKDFSSLKKRKKENIDDYRYISSVPGKRLREQMLKETAERRKNAESLKIQKEQERKLLKEKKWENKQLKKSFSKLNGEYKEQGKIQNKINNILKKRKKEEEKEKNKKPQKKFDFTIPAYWKRYGGSRFIGNTITASALTTAMTLAVGAINKSKRDVWVNEMIGNKNPIDYVKHNILMKRMMRAGATREQAVNSIYMLGSALNNPIKLQKMMESTLTGLSPYMNMEQAMKRLSTNQNNIAQQMIRDFFGFDFAKINYDINEKDLKAEEDIMKNQLEIVNAQRELSVVWNKILDRTTILSADILKGRFEKISSDYFGFVKNLFKKGYEKVGYIALKNSNIEIYEEMEKDFKEKGINLNDLTFEEFENEFLKRLEKEYVNRTKFDKMKEDTIQNVLKDSFSNNVADKQVNKNITLNVQINQLSEVADLLTRMQNENLVDKISNNIESTLQNLKIHPDSILLGE